MEEIKPEIKEEKKEENTFDKAEAMAKRIEEANKRQEEILKRNEEIASKILLSGRAEAGQVRKSPEQEMDEEADRQAKEIIKRFRR